VTERPLHDVADAIREEGGLLAGALAPEDAWADLPTPLADLAAAGPRSSGRERDVAFVIEAVHEGWRLHHGGVTSPPRLIATEDEDLALLAGDRLYALGLQRLADAGDLASVGELADVIALCAQARAVGRDEVADAAWEAGAVAVGWGADAALESAKEQARTQDPDALDSLRSAARALAGQVAPEPQ
jgi:hypothetical protein